MSKLLAKLLGFEVVWIQHFDGELYKKWVRPTPFGSYGFAMSWIFRVGSFTCLPDGTCSGASYVRRWKAA